MKYGFEWDEKKNLANQAKHRIDFYKAQQAFSDPRRIIVADALHSTPQEERFFCIGRIGEDIVTVRFTWRCGIIRIFGAGYWREGKSRYEKQ